MIVWIIIVALVASAHCLIEFGTTSLVTSLKEYNGSALNQTGIVNCIITDPANSQNLIITTDTAIYQITRNDSQTPKIQLLVGNPLVLGYVEGEGSKARFDEMREIVWLGDKYVISDSDNDCLRFVEWTNNRYRTRRAVGTCQDEGDRDGALLASRLNQPYGLAYRDEMLYVADGYNKKVKRISLVDDQILTIHKSNNFRLADLVLGPAEMEFYVTVPEGVLHVSGGVEVILVGGRTQGLTDGQFSGVQFDTPQGLSLLGDDHILVADHWNSRIRLLDLRRKSVSSICDGEEAYREGDITSCRLLQPRAVTVTDKYIYVGELSVKGGGVRRIEYTITGNGRLKRCPEPEAITNGYYTQVSSESESFSVGATISYNCNGGYSVASNGTGQMTCTRVGTRPEWVGEMITCRLSTAIACVFGPLLGVALVVSVILAIQLKRRRGGKVADAAQTGDRQAPDDNSYMTSDQKPNDPHAYDIPTLHYDDDYSERSDEDPYEIPTMDYEDYYDENGGAPSAGAESLYTYYPDTV